MALLLIGLNLCERGLYEVNGWENPQGAFMLVRDGKGGWLITVTGREYYVDLSELKSLLWHKFMHSVNRLSVNGTSAIMY